MKNKICKCENCGQRGVSHLFKTYTCKKFEPQEVCGHSDALHKKYGMGDDCKPKNHDYWCSDCNDFFKEPHSYKNHSHPDESLMNPKTSYPGPDNSPQSRSETPNKKQNEDTLSSKIVDLTDVWTNFPFIPVTDIKDFIQKLKEKPYHKNWEDWVNELAGAELT